MSRPRFKTRFDPSKAAPISTWIASNQSEIAADATTYLLAGMNQEGTKELRELFDAQLLDYPKPVSLISELVRCASDSGDIVLDFFAGSCSTAQAVIEQPGRRRFICVQLAEQIDQNSEAGALGFQSIADVGRERIRKVIKRKSKHTDGTSDFEDVLGFKSFRLAPSNLKQWRGDGIESADELAEQMQMFVRSEKDDADTEDILYELLLKFGQELTTPVESLEIESEPVFAIRGKEMLFVLAGFNEAMIDAIVALKPQEVIALDSVFHDSDELKSNLDLQCRDAGIRLTCI